MENYVVTLTPDEFSRLYAPNPAEKISAAERFSRALDRAANAALVHASEDDGGTCNFDSPALDPKSCGLTRKKVIEILAAHNLRCYDWKLGGTKALVLCGFTSGQGNRRTSMAEAACRSLEADGYSVCMYYQMD